MVVVAVATMVFVKVSGSPRSPAGSAGGTAGHSSGSVTSEAGTTLLPSSVLQALSVAPSTLDAVGTPASVAPPVRVGGTAVARGADDKVLVTYIGAEYCPYCAAERWAIAVALSRFGTFSQLSGTQSSGTDIYPDTQTLSFYSSTYTSAYLDFRSVEETTNQRSGSGYRPLQAPTASEQALMTRQDPSGSIPFLDVANKYMVTGASFSPQVLAGLSRGQIAAQLGDPVECGGPGHRRNGQLPHGRHQRRHRSIAVQRGQLARRVGDRQEVGGVKAPRRAMVASSGLSLAAVAIASYLTAAHYSGSSTLACPDTGVVNCALVTTSSWSTIAGIPLAVLGLVWAVAMAGLTLPWAWRSGRASLERIRLWAAAAGALMVVYLVYVELFMIGAICLWCTAMHLTAVALFGVVLAAGAGDRRRVTP